MTQDQVELRDGSPESSGKLTGEGRVWIRGDCFRFRRLAWSLLVCRVVGDFLCPSGVALT